MLDPQERLNAHKALRRLAATDPDPTVSAAAQQALKWVERSQRESFFRMVVARAGDLTKPTPVRLQAIDDLRVLLTMG